MAPFNSDGALWLCDGVVVRPQSELPGAGGKGQRSGGGKGCDRGGQSGRGLRGGDGHHEGSGMF